MPRSFFSDNNARIAPSILEAILKANDGTASAYGADGQTDQLEARFGEIFGAPVRMFGVPTGTAANALAVSSLTPPWGAVLCHEEAHLAVDECGAPELFTGGAKVVPLPGAQGKLTPDRLSCALDSLCQRAPHQVPPAALSVSQVTECGTVYTASELAALCHVAKKRNLGVHMDGARFANAVVSLGVTPAALTREVGIDVLSFGATKNGAMAAEAVIFFDPERAKGFEFRRKRGGHLISKMRFLSAQLLAYLSENFWLDRAAHANRLARRLAEGLEQIDGVSLAYPCQANMVFARLPTSVINRLRQEGFQFYDWGDGGTPLVRLVTAFDTVEEDVDLLVARAAGGPVLGQYFGGSR